MADLVLGIGTSHGPMLNTPPSQWHQRGTADRGNTGLMLRGEALSFAELSRRRNSSEYEPQLAPDVQHDRYERCRASLDVLGQTLLDADVDAVVIVSSDHKELFGDEWLAGFTVFWGQEVAHLPISDAALARMSPGLATSARGYVPEEPTSRACVPDLARTVISTALEDGFDVAASEVLPAGKHGNHGLPHGWGFIFQQVMRTPVPMVPIFVNTFYPPNQPTAQRCYDFGRSLGRAVAAWDGPGRVAVIASGGLTHFVIDEEFDQDFLTALEKDDGEALGAIDASWLESGSSEMRNWIVLAGAMSGTSLGMDLVDYVPCYRTEAGTGNAMAFSRWV